MRGKLVKVFRIFAVFVLLLSCGISEVNADLLTYEIVGDAVTIKDCKETA